MSYQLVVSGNRILAYGSDCFYSMGGTVICPSTERVYQNATVVNCDAIPADIDIVGYEYHSGDFVPCAPFGIGNGNIAVVCGNDCKALKDSGISLEKIKQGGVLLWENASPSSAFNGQTIKLASDDWDFLIVEMSIGGGVILSDLDVTKSVIHPIMNTSGISNISRIMQAKTKESVLFGAASGIKWSLSSGVGAYNPTTYSSNSDIVPLKIYGVKIGG